ncbi:MAG TPA: hypothetical protein VI977_04810 [archaeon]|nr:hypothetical protein [archaeon]
MTIGLGQSRVLKEARFEITKNGEVTGFLDLVSKPERIFLDGKIEYFNDETLEEIKNKQKFPIIIHFRIKKPLTEDQIIPTGNANETRTAKEYLTYFNGNQKIGKRISLGASKIFLNTETSSKPFGDLWRFGAELSEMAILEAKNVPGLKDVKNA